MRGLLHDLGDATIVVLSLHALIRYLRGDRLRWVRRTAEDRATRYPGNG